MDNKHCNVIVSYSDREIWNFIEILTIAWKLVEL